MDEIFPICQERTQMRFACWWRVDDLTSAGICKCCAGHSPNPHFGSFDRAADFFRRAGGKRTIPQRVVAIQQCSTVAQRLLRGCVSLLIARTKLKKPVGTCYDILDFRTGLSLKQGQRIDENPLVRDQLRCLFQLRQGCAGPNALLQNRFCLQLHTRWKKRNLVKWLIRLPRIGKYGVVF